jgi:hypothetical protein
MPDGDPVFDQCASECRADELAALIGVEDFRLAVTSQSILQRLDQNAASIVIDTLHDSTRRLNR